MAKRTVPCHQSGLTPGNSGQRSAAAEPERQVSGSVQRDNLAPANLSSRTGLLPAT